MKKFVVIMISALVLITFLMLNYLVWDMENLQKQRETDKVEQDWLRGQNRILTTTVNELEQANSKLEKETKEQKDKIDDLEARIQFFQQRVNDNLTQIEEQAEALNQYKNLMGDKVKDIVGNWFLLINQKKYEDSYSFLGENSTVFGGKYDKDSYIELISAIDSISIVESSENITNAPITIIENSEPKVILAQIQVQAYVVEAKKESLPAIVDGANLLEFSLTYNHISENWVILSIVTKNSGNP